MQTFDHCASTFEVKEPYNPSIYQYKWCYKVNISDEACDYGEFQVEKLPCAHVFVACTKLSLDPCQFVDRIFWLDTIMNMYNNRFHLIRDVVHWPSPLGLKSSA